MRVTLTTPRFGPDGGSHADEVIDVPEETARELVAGRYGFFTDPESASDEPDPETADAPPGGETASLKSRGKRSK